MAQNQADKTSEVFVKTPNSHVPFVSKADLVSSFVECTSTLENLGHLWLQVHRIEEEYCIASMLCFDSFKIV